MISSLLIAGAVGAGCLSANPPAGCPSAQCGAKADDASCVMDQAVQRQLKETWKQAKGVEAHGSMVRAKAAKKVVEPAKVVAPSNRWARCTVGAVGVAGGVALLIQENWIARTVGAIAGVAGLWVCAR